MDDLVGKTLGRYRIVAQIGEGGMATVYKAYHPGLDHYVAVKVLPPYYAQAKDFVERFRQEARVVARLRHPNILTVYDFGEAHGLTYIVMELVEEGTLKERLGRPLSLDKAVALAIQVGQALDYAHAEGIIHRDIKPSNVLLPREDWALLSDFGIAKVVESTLGLTRTGVGIGTPEYMSPEQGQGLPLDGRSDIYSLGVMLYEMVTGRVPFSADTPLAVVIKHMTEPLPPPRQINSNVPRPVEQVILKAMAKEPEGRFQTAGEMVQALEAIRRAGEVVGPPGAPPKAGVEAPPPRGPVPPTVLDPPRVERPRLNRLWLITPLLALLLVGGAFLVLSNLRGSPAATPAIPRGLAAVVATTTLAPASTPAAISGPAPTQAPTTAPARTPARVVAATATLKPTSSSAVVATTTLRPAADTPTTVPPVASPTSAAPVRTPTSAPPRTPTPPGAPAVALLAPEDGAQLQGRVTFRWTWGVNLGPGEVFDVRVCKGQDCQPRFGKTNTGDTTWMWQPDQGAGTYRWQVVVIRWEEGRVVAEQAHSPVWRIEWSGGGDGGKPEPTPSRPP